VTWNDSTNSWKGHQKYETTYDANNNPTSGINYTWNEQGEIWIEYYKMEQVFNSSNDPIEFTSFSWNEISSTWVFNKNAISTVDESFSKDQLLLPSNRSYRYNSMLLNEINNDWDINSNSWKTMGQNTYYYSDQVVNSVINVDANSILVFPNPFSNSIRFKLENATTSYTFDVYDTQGKKVLTQQITSNQVIDTESLSTGLYLYTLTNGNEIFKGKIVKQ